MEGTERLVFRFVGGEVGVAGEAGVRMAFKGKRSE